MITEREIQAFDQEALRLLEAHHKGQHAAILNEVDELAKAGPLSPAVLGLASLALSELERYDEAAKAANHAVHLAPDQAWLFHALARGEAGQKRLTEAVAAQRQAVRLMPAEAGYAAKLAAYLRESGQPAEAARVARQALVTSPDHAGALNELGLALQAAGDRSGALEQFRLAQAADREDPTGYLNEGSLHLEAGDLSAARRALREALRREPGLTEAEDRMAETLAGRTGFMRSVLLHLLNLGRVTIIGWSIIAFLYYLLFRLVEFVWKVAPAFLPVGQALLVVTLAYLLGGMMMGHIMRLAFRTVWPR